MPRIYIIGVWVCFLMAALASCSRPARNPCNLAAGDLREGDLLFRRGSSTESRAVTLLDGFYSHVGIVVDSGGGALRIVHAVPDEPDFPGDSDRVKMDPLARFLSPDRAEAACLMRPADSLAARTAARAALRFWQRATPFDHDYDETDTLRMYCTELVVYAYRLAGWDIAGPERRHVETVWLTADCILPAQVRECSLFSEVKKY